MMSKKIKIYLYSVPILLVIMIGGIVPTDNQSSITSENQHSNFNLVDDDANRIIFFHAEWSPDSEYIAFTSNLSGNNDIWIMNKHGAELRNLTQNQQSSDYSPKWSPDGKSIAFISDRSGNNDIWITSVTNNEPQNLTSFDPISNSTIGWSQDGQHIIYSSFSLSENVNDIWIIRSDGTQPENLTAEVDLQWGSSSVSPDGTQIAASIWGRNGLMLINLSDTTFESLTNTRLDGNVSWSPIGNLIAMENTDIPTGSESLWVISSDGINFDKLTDDRFNSINGYSWSPDGNQIVFSTFMLDEEYVVISEVWKINLETGDFTLLTSNRNALIFEPQWSPDGEKILYILFQENRQHIWIMNTDGSDSLNLTEELVPIAIQ